jgi:hypothetical protein
MPLMKRLFWVRAAICALWGLWVASAWAQSPAGAPAVAAAAQAADATPPASSFRLPNVNEVRLPVQRQVQAASTLLGYGRQRLALVVGIGTLGSRQVLDSAARDTLAVATALRAGGFVVMVREDVNGADLRSALKEYRERMQPDGVGFIYLTGLGAQVDGQNLLLPRNTRLDADASAAAVAAQVKASGVPLQEVVEALMSTPESARLLVVDAAYNHPALAKLPRPGLAEQRLPPGMLALFSQALAAAQDVPAIAALPTPAPKDPREIAGSRFARVLVGTLVTPRISAGDALRNTHKALVDGAPDQAPPWLGGKSDNKEDLAEASLLDGLFPRTPEELAREALKQITRAAVRDGSGSGATAAAPAGAPSPVSAPSPALPAGPRVPELPAGGGSALGSVTSTVSTVASAAGSVATVAAGAATVAVGTQALVAATGTVATAATAATAATTTAAAAVSTAGSVAGSVVGGTARILSTTTGEQSARQAVQTTLARSPVASAATTATASAAPGAATAAATSAAPGATTAAATTASPAATTAAAAAVAPAAAAAPAAPAAAAAAVAAPAAAPAAAGAALSAAAPVGAAAPALTAASLAAGAPVAVSSLTPSSAPTLPGGGPAASATPPAPEAPAPATSMASPTTSAPTSTTGNPAGNTTRNPLDGRTQRGAQGGEQPVYNPRTNRYGYTEGDTFTYQVIDAWKEEVTGTFTTAIEEVLGDGKLLANGQSVEMDAQGRIKSQRRPDGTQSRFEPQQDLWWSNPKPGQSRDVSFKEFFDRPGGERGQMLYEGSSNVGKLRKIETPAGEFDVMPIETTGYFSGKLANGVQRSGQFTRRVWYSPKLGHPVRIDITDTDRVGKLLVRERVELMHAQRAPLP